VVAHDEGDLHRPALLAQGAQHIASVVSRVDLDADLARPLVLVAEDAGVEPAAGGVTADRHRRGDVFAGVQLLVHEQRQRAHVDLVAGQHHLVHGRLLGGDRCRGDAVPLAARVLLHHAVHVGVEAERETLVRAVQVDQQRDWRALHVLEQHSRESGVAWVVLGPVDDRGGLELGVDLLGHGLELLGVGLDQLVQVGAEVLGHGCLPALPGGSECWTGPCPLGWVTLSS